MTEEAFCPWNGVAPTGPVLRPDAAAQYLGISTAAYYVGANAGKLPKPFKIGERATGVCRPWLDAVIGHAAAGGVR